MRQVVASSALVAVVLGSLALLCAGSKSDPGANRGPKPAVEDAAQLLGPFGIVVAKLAAITREDLGVDVRVATRREGSEEIATVAERLFREWKVGAEAPTGGVLILLDDAGRRARIEVSYSLEGVLPDVVLSRIAHDQLVPYASHRAAGMAVMDVLQFLRDRMLDAVASDALEVPEPVRQGLGRRRLLAGRSGGAGAQVEIPALPSHTELKQRVPDVDRARFSASEDPLESVTAFRRAMREGVGDPSLDLYTAGTRVMRERYPIAPYEELLRAEAIDRSEPLVLQVQGEFALVGSQSAVRGFVPILLAREAGLWRVDLVETYKNFFFDEAGRYRLVNRATPYSTFVADPNVPSDDGLRPIDLHGETLKAAIERLEASDLPAARFRLAEILMRNCWVTSEAIPLYLEAVRAAPHEAHFASVLADRASHLGMPEIAIGPIEQLGPPYWPRLARLYERAGRPALARTLYEKTLARNPRSREARAGLERLMREQTKG